MTDTIVLHPGSVDLATLERIFRTGDAIRLDPGCRPAVERSAGTTAEAASGSAAVYGLHTGLVKLASKLIAP